MESSGSDVDRGAPIGEHSLVDGHQAHSVLCHEPRSPVRKEVAVHAGEHTGHDGRCQCPRRSPSAMASRWRNASGELEGAGAHASGTGVRTHSAGRFESTGPSDHRPRA